MKITISKNAKRALSLVLAFAMILGSLFVANVGVNISANAETETTIQAHQKWDGTYSIPDDIDGDGIYDITTPEELAWIALYGGAATAGKIYKVAVANSIFNMNGFEGIDLNSTATDIQNATETGNYWYNSTANEWQSTGVYTSFQGSFDGNGVILYNICAKANTNNGAGKVGLFPFIQASGFDSTITNIRIVSSAFLGGNYLGAIAGEINGNNYNLDIINCAVENCYYGYNGANPNKKSGVFVGINSHYGLTISNCYAANNSFDTANLLTHSGFIGDATQYGNGLNFNNSVIIGASPYPVLENGASLSEKSKLPSAPWTNVYTNVTLESAINGITTLTDSQMTGANAFDNMSLDFKTVWLANTTTYPVLRSSHILGYDKGVDTHTLRCELCGLQGFEENHLYNIIDYDQEISKCACGDWEYGTNDVWDGTKATSFASGSGTKEDPYIIETVEQLFKMVRDEGVKRDASGNKIDKDGNVIDESDYENEVAAYYKVADYVNALYINDTRGYSNQAAFRAAAAADTLNNWSGDLTENVWCSCGNTHSYGYHHSFAGNFDGNGVTIYGLYSYLAPTQNGTGYDSSVPGIGFVPGLLGDALIKNVIFDTSYVYNTKSCYAGIVTSSFGFEYDSSKTYCTNDKIGRNVNDANVTIANVAVLNSHHKINDGYYTYAGKNTLAAGIIAASRDPKSLTITNCLFDGRNATFDTTCSTGTAYNCGIYARGVYANGTTITNCVSIGYDAIIVDADRDKGSNILAYNNYACDVDIDTPYLVANSSKYTDYATKYRAPWTINDAVYIANDGYTKVSNMPSLNWTQWDCSSDTIAKYGTPMPVFDSDDALANDHYKQQYKGMASAPNTGYEQGVFSYFNALVGGGTEADPYIISDAETLFAIIASGGLNRGVPQHYKLGCNIDLGGVQWVDANDWIHEYDVIEDGVVIETREANYYIYKNFAGTIDGDGHTITGMFAYDNTNAAGFIPVLASTGVIKNIHFRDSYAYSKAGAGVIVGNAAEGAQIINCSIEDSSSTTLAGGNATITNCFYTTVNENGVVTATYNGETPVLDGENWYGIEGGIARPVSFAQAQPYADIDADGVGEEYTGNDLTALKQRLLRKSAYKNVYGDASGNGKTDMRDLAAVIREMDTDNEWTALDGFWKNVKASNIGIYYNDSDNYDFARKLELYLEEAMPGADIKKYLNADKNELAIKLVTGEVDNGDDWSYSYDIENAVLTITGVNFTAVEEAVDDFIAQTDVFTNPGENSGSLDDVVNLQGDTYKKSITVNGQPYFYTWGDEFDGGDTVTIDDTEYTTVSYDKWLLRNKSVDETLKDDDTSNDLQSEFAYIRAAKDDEALLINQVNDGKLTLKRGFTQNDLDYKYYVSGLSSKGSMLFKQGYMEMKATLPADGYAFPAWWLYTHASGGNSNSAIANSLYSKVYNKNNAYDGSSSFVGTNYKSYQYKLPTQTLEMDLFEIIQRPDVTYDRNTSGTFVKTYTYSNFRATGSSDDLVKFNIHKWYSYSRTIVNETNLNVYNLDWNKTFTEDNLSFDTLLTATRATKKDDFAISGTPSIDYSTTNITDGSVNVPVGASSKYNTTIALNSAETQLIEYRYGFLWTEDTMTFMAGPVDGDMATIATINKSDLKLGDTVTFDSEYGFNQYAYFLIENHMFTSNTYSLSLPDKNISPSYDTYSGRIFADLAECDMVIDYVRLYQLDGARDIVTPETERLEDIDCR